MTAPAPTPAFPVLCAWCSTLVGECEVENSTGMCAECLAKLYPEEDEP